MKIGFIGLGNMASAIIRGICRSPELEGVELFGYNPSPEKLQRLQQSYRISGCTDNVSLCRQCDVIVLAVKPQMTEAVFSEVRDSIAGKFVVSVVAGKTLAYLKERINCPICRTAPNINAKIGASITGYCFSDDVSKSDRALAETILSAIGETIEVPEQFIRIVSSVGGASPAYTYMYINALAEAALKAGMPKEKALRLAAASVKGSAEMVLSSGLHPYALVDQVTSPGGSTVEGLIELQRQGFEYAVESAIEAVMEKDKKF